MSALAGDDYTANIKWLGINLTIYRQIAQFAKIAWRNVRRRERTFLQIRIGSIVRIIIGNDIDLRRRECGEGHKI